MKKRLYISSLSSEAQGIGSDAGLKVFVEGALPWETALIQIVEKKKNYAKANLLSVLEASPERIQPICPLFGNCGGCHMMHLQYEAQLRIKTQRVLDAFERIGHFSSLPILPCVPSPQSLHYRNKIQLPVVWKEGKKTMGLYRKDSHTLIPLSKCWIQCEEGEKIVQFLDKHLNLSCVKTVLIRNGFYTKECLIVLVTDGKEREKLILFAKKIMDAHPSIKGVVENINHRKDNVLLGNTFHTLAGRTFIFEKLLNKTFKISPAAFFQVNPIAAELLYKKAIESCQIQKDETVLDAYSGVGTLALFAADFAKEVIGIEAIEQAVKDAKENANLNKVSNCRFYFGAAEKRIHALHFDTVFLNPPRKGCDKKVLECLLQKKPKKILYISCDPATLARDVQMLSVLYKPDFIQPFDMFPQTMHVETVVKLTRIC